MKLKLFKKIFGNKKVIRMILGTIMLNAFIQIAVITHACFFVRSFFLSIGYDDVLLFVYLEFYLIAPYLILILLTYFMLTQVFKYKEK